MREANIYIAFIAGMIGAGFIVGHGVKTGDGFSFGIGVVASGIVFQLHLLLLK